MPEVIASYQVSAFVVPSNLTTGDADQVRGNDNTLQASLNNHDADPGVHFQSSTLAARPVAGGVGRKWMSSDDRRIWYDNGSSWLESAYASTAAPTFTGVITHAGSIQTAGNLTLNATGIGASVITVSGSLGLTTANGNLSLFAGGGSLLLSTSGANVISFSTASTVRWSVNAAGHLIAGADGTYDIGTAGASRVRTIYSNGTTTVVSATGTKVLGVQQTGWTTDPTGTLTRTTFISDSVTLVELAKRVAALIVDLRTHGLVGP